MQALLERHRPGTLYELAMFLDKPKWLGDQDISIVDYVVGYIPVEGRLGDTVFHIRLLPGPARDKTDIHVYMRVMGKVARDDFSHVVRSDRIALPLPPIAGQPILQFGFSGPSR